MIQLTLKKEKQGIPASWQKGFMVILSESLLFLHQEGCHQAVKRDQIDYPTYMMRFKAKAMSQSQIKNTPSTEAEVTNLMKESSWIKKWDQSEPKEGYNLLNGQRVPLTNPSPDIHRITQNTTINTMWVIDIREKISTITQITFVDQKEKEK